MDTNWIKSGKEMIARVKPGTRVATTDGTELTKAGDVLVKDTKGRIELVRKIEAEAYNKEIDKKAGR